MNPIGFTAVRQLPGIAPSLPAAKWSLKGSGTRNFYHIATNRDQPTDGGERRSEEVAQPGLAGIATGMTNDQRWRSDAQLQCHEVTTNLKTHDSLSFPASSY